MADFAGLMMPRPVHAAGPSHEERGLARTLVTGVDVSNFVRGLGPATETCTDFCDGGTYVDAEDHLPRPAQRLDTHPGKQGLIELVYDQ